MAGIYVHIPFCRKACNYCNFYFSTKVKTFEEIFTKSLEKEIELQGKYFAPPKEIDSIYFGGGTPSLLKGKLFEKSMTALYRHFHVKDKIECTIEINPEDITHDKLNIYKRNKVNRLSIGIQSFFDEDLKWMNRGHTSNEAKKAVMLGFEAGFTNISIDLIYGYPLLNQTKWVKNIETAIDLEVQHISCYGMTLEKNTRYGSMVRLNKEQAPSDDKQARQHETAHMILSEVGFEHYEVSNYAKTGFRAVHNSNYWNGESYIGLGPSAHSYNGEQRRWNVANIKTYVDRIERNELFFEEEMLSPKDKYNEYVMLNIRKIEGVNIDRIKEQFGDETFNFFMKGVEKINTEWFSIEKNNLRLSPKGFLFADHIISSLFMVN